MKKVIVTTTINPPTEAMRRFEAVAGWDLVVVGDLKTPKDYQLDHSTYVSPEMQEEYDKALSDAIGWNCIMRRSFGLLWAHDMGADVVAVVDDDNIPYENWGMDLLIGRKVEVNYYQTKLPAFDPIGATNEGHLWHRGYPLELIPKRDYSRKTSLVMEPDVQADLWDGDPDIDALCRMVYAPECKFDEKYFPFASNKIAPFDSQNTFLRGSLLKNYFLFPHVGRMDDIWASYYIQAMGGKVVFNKPSVYQARNEHNSITDMKNEYIGYENNLKLVRDIAKDPEQIFKYLPKRTVEAFSLYRRHFSA